MLLPTKHYFTELVIRKCHKTVFHYGISETLVSLRERYWVFRGWEAVKKLIRKCVVCQRYEGKAYAGPPTPDLPTQRVSTDPPFNNTDMVLYTHLHQKQRKTRLTFAYSHELPLEPYT